MTEEICYWILCLVPPAQVIGVKIFGFSEFISALALLVVLYTIVDIRYKFRLSITPGALYRVTFVLMVIIGCGTLLSEIWLAEGWWIPKTAGLTRAIWQGIFGFLFLISFLTWLYYAFIRPPVFGKRNAERYAKSLYAIILKGNDAEISVIANELARSAKTLVKLSKLLPPRSHVVDDARPEEINRRKATAEDYAYNILLLIANKKLCRHIVDSSPVTAIEFFEAMTAEKKYDIPIGHFAKTISAEAITNRDSFLYQEESSFASGLIGCMKPWTKTVYGNFELIETLASNYGSPLEIDHRAIRTWDAEQWEIYRMASIAAFNGYLTSCWLNLRSYALNQLFQCFEYALFDIDRLNQRPDDFRESDINKRFHVVIKFALNVMTFLDKGEIQPSTKLRRKSEPLEDDIYDRVVDLMLKIIGAAASISGPPAMAWTIHSSAWTSFFNRAPGSRAWKIVQFKLRRRLYDEVCQMKLMPDHRSAKILGLLLNVTWAGEFKSTTRIRHERTYWPLATAVRAWTKRNYLSLRESSPVVAEAVIIGLIRFDRNGRRLVKTYVYQQGTEEYLYLDGGVSRG